MSDALQINRSPDLGSSEWLTNVVAGISRLLRRTRHRKPASRYPWTRPTDQSNDYWSNYWRTQCLLNPLHVLPRCSTGRGNLHRSHCADILGLVEDRSSCVVLAFGDRQSKCSPLAFIHLGDLLSHNFRLGIRRPSA